jgi:hypothetical protein
MFLGHYAVGLVAKPLTPRLSLGALFLAGQLLDLIWPALVLSGIESVAVAPGATLVTPLDFISYLILIAWLWRFSGLPSRVWSPLP